MCKFCYLLFFLLLLGCKTPQSPFSTNLQELDKLLSQHPKLVADSLSRLNVSGMHKADQAYFYLLEASAKDKNYRKLENDSTLRIAEKYFTHTADHYNLGRTQYYIAKYFFSTNNPTDAFIILKEAEHNIQKSPTPDFHILGLIYSLLGTIQGNQNNHTEAEKYYQKAILNFSNDKDSISVSFTEKQLAWSYIFQNKYDEAEKVLLNILNTIQCDITNNNTQIFKLYISTLNALNQYYQKTFQFEKTLTISNEYIIKSSEYKKLRIPSSYYSTLITSLKELNKTDSLEYYCNKMLSSAKEEKNIKNQANSYKTLSEIEYRKNNFKEACELKEKYISLKDTYNTQLKFDELVKLEKKYNYSEKERLFYKAKNKNLWLLILILILILIASLILLYSSWLQRKLKNKNLQLSEQIKKVEWGLTLSKELIKDNTNQYFQLEGVLNRYASLIPQQLFEEFRSLHHSQQIHYSQRLLLSLTNINNEFTRRLKQKHPDLTSNDILLASMLHYQWELEDIAQVFQTSLEAIQKRSSRLKTKLRRRGADIKRLENTL